MAESTTVDATVTVSPEVYASLPSRPDRVRECINAAEQAMSATASERGRVICETPRLVDQQSKALGFVGLIFQAETSAR